MAKITKIEEQKNDINRVNVYIDNEFFIGISKEIAYKLRLEEDTEVDKNKLSEVVEEEKLIKAKKKSYQILNNAMQSEGQLRDKLSNRGFEDDIIDKVVESLKEYNMINDEVMARSIVRDKKNLKKYGKKRIIYELRKKKIDKRIIATAIEELEENEEYNNAVILAKKKLRGIKDTDRRKIYQKLAQYLTYRGYNYDIIKKAIKEVTKEDLL